MKLIIPLIIVSFMLSGCETNNFISYDPFKDTHEMIEATKNSGKRVYIGSAELTARTGTDKEMMFGIRNEGEASCFSVDITCEDRIEGECPDINGWFTYDNNNIDIEKDQAEVIEFSIDAEETGEYKLKLSVKKGPNCNDEIYKEEEIYLEVI